MNTAEKIQLLELLTRMAIFYNKEIKIEALEIYVLALEKYPMDKIKAAAGEIAARHKFMPMPADFIEIIDPPEQIELRTAEAFKKFEDTVMLAGPYESVTFTDPVICAVIQNLGGWIKVISDTDNMDSKEYGFFRKRWEQLYQAYMHKEGLKPIILIGSHDAHNGPAGYLDENKNLITRTGALVERIPFCIDGDVQKVGQQYLLPDNTTIGLDNLLEDMTNESKRG